ncbi:MAG: alpha-amylase family glycosyl hydrolase [Candidatus Eisenbacteria bacterium]|nr:alpha-amylase family glycosyl hydrolase [Candidatus Eisenbacteria bacterium]
MILVWYNDEIPSTGPPSADFAADTQTLLEDGAVHFEDRSAGLIDSWEWTFEGGSPGTSSEVNPIVVYPQAGTFDVALVVSNTTESDTLVVSDFIQVSERDTSEISWWNDTVYYEIFVRSFYDSDGDGIGDLIGLTQKLNYLNDNNPNTDDDLGITGIWLMPINDSPSYHGYDVIDYRSINPDYGSMDDFRDFLDEAHNRGIRVIIDYVMNHSSNQHPWFQQSAQNNPAYRNFYRWSSTKPGYLGPWGQQVWHRYGSKYYYGLFGAGMPDLNYETPAVKDSMFAIANYWLNTVGVDGFRLDAVLYIIEEGSVLANTQSTYQFWHDFNQNIKQAKPDAMSVGEAWTNTNTILNYVTNDRLDYCFEFDLASAILNSVNSGNARGIVNKMQEVYNVYPHLQYGTFLANHDQTRVIDVLGYSINKAKVAASLYLTLPGVPYLYYGEEIGMEGTGADELKRRPMQWSDETNAGFTSGTPWIAVGDNYPTYNVSTEQEDPTSLLSWYKQLIAVRNREAALRLGEYAGTVSSASPVMAFIRHYRDESILVIINTGSSDKGNLTLSLVGNSVGPGDYVLSSLLTSDTLLVSVNDSYEITNLVIDGFETLIYSLSDRSSTGIDVTKGIFGDFRLHQNFPNPFNPSTVIRYDLPKFTHVEIKIYNLLGQEIRTLTSKNQSAGRHSIEWDGRDIAGNEVASGLYLYSIFTGDFRQTRKMLLIR